MKNFDFNSVTGDGTLYTNGIVGLVSRNMFLEDELPDNVYIYLLHHPKRRRHTWLLENMDEVSELPKTEDRYGFADDDIPEFAFVCFCQEPEFDYLSFEDSDDYDTYIEWNSGHTMQDILDQSILEEE